MPSLGEPFEPGAVRVGDGERFGAVFHEDEAVRVARLDGDARQDVQALVGQPDGTKVPHRLGELSPARPADVGQDRRFGCRFAAGSPARNSRTWVSPATASASSSYCGDLPLASAAKFR